MYNLIGEASRVGSKSTRGKRESAAFLALESNSIRPASIRTWNNAPPGATWQHGHPRRLTHRLLLSLVNRPHISRFFP